MNKAQKTWNEHHLRKAKIEKLKELAKGLHFCKMVTMTSYDSGTYSCVEADWFAILELTERVLNEQANRNLSR